MTTDHQVTHELDRLFAEQRTATGHEPYSKPGLDPDDVRQELYEAGLAHVPDELVAWYTHRNGGWTYMTETAISLEEAITLRRMYGKYYTGFELSTRWLLLRGNTETYTAAVCGPGPVCPVVRWNMPGPERTICSSLTELIAASTDLIVFQRETGSTESTGTEFERGQIIRRFYKVPPDIPLAE